MQEDNIILALKSFENCPVRGHIKIIDDIRLVFIGEDPGDLDRIYLIFRSSEGEDTKICLSREGYEALKYLIKEPFKGKRVPFPYRLTLQVKITEKVD